MGRWEVRGGRRGLRRMSRPSCFSSLALLICYDIVPFLVAVHVPEPKISKGRQVTCTATPSAETVGIAAQLSAVLKAASLSDLFSPGISVPVSHGGKPSRDLVVISYPTRFSIAVGSGPIPPWYYNASPGGGSESKMLPPHYFEIPLDGSVRFSSGSVLG